MQILASVKYFRGGRGKITIITEILNRVNYRQSRIFTGFFTFLRFCTRICMGRRDVIKALGVAARIGRAANRSMSSGELAKLGLAYTSAICLRPGNS